MKHYLHMITRSLCIMLMLCGISNGAWADFSEGDGSQGTPYVITTEDHWNELVSSYDSSAETYYKLGESITLTSAPTSSLDITSDYLDLNSCTITVGSDSYDLTFPDTFYPVFSESSGLEDGNVTYYFGVSSYSDLQNISNNNDAISDKTNINFSVPSSFVIDSSPTETLNMPSYFSFNDGDITVGDENNPVSFPTDTFYPVFSDDSGLNSNVKYYFCIESDGSNWNDFVSFYNDLYNNSNASNVYLVINSDITFEEGQGNDPTESLYIDSSNLKVSGEYKLYVSSDCSCDVFSDSDMNDAYVDGGASGWTVTNDNWNDFIAAYENSQIDAETLVTISGDIVTDYEHMPTSVLSSYFSSNLEAESGSTITIKINCLEGLKTLRDDISAWEDLATNYYISVTAKIDLTENDINLPDDWTDVIDDTNIAIDYEGDKHIVFPTTTVSGISSPLYLFYSDSDNLNTHCQYKELTFNSTDEIEIMAGWNPSILAATRQLTLTEDIDYITASAELPTGAPMTFTGTFVPGDYTITLPKVSASTPIANLPVLFANRPDITYARVIYIDNDNDLAKFIEYQDAWKAVSTEVECNNNTFIVESFCTISKDFNITCSGDYYFYLQTKEESPLNMKDFVPLFENDDYNSKVAYIVYIDSYEGFDKLKELKTYYNESNNTSITICPNTNKGTKWYDYDLSGYDFGSNTYPVSTSANVVILFSDKNNGSSPVLHERDSESDLPDGMTTYYAPSCFMIDALYEGAYLTDPSKRNSESTWEEDGVLNSTIASMAYSYPYYYIWTYGMLEELVDYLNKHPEYDTQGITIQLRCDINAQNNERLTGVDGKITLSPYNNQTVQFSNDFKGTFYGGDSTIGGLTRPLFKKLDGATIKNLGIVDCNMTGPALTEAAVNSTATKCFVSGVSDDLIPATGFSTIKNCYAFNPKTYADSKCTGLATTEANGYKAYNIVEGTGTDKVTLSVDISGTHKVFITAYNSFSDKYSDCTLFEPKDNTIYTYSNTPWESYDSYYLPYIAWESDTWVKSPYVCNICLLHNIMYYKYWKFDEAQYSSVSEYGSENPYSYLNYLYSWYIVDRTDLPYTDSEMLQSRVNNIYYNRQNKNTNDVPAPDGFNTIYLPFAWNPATDLYYKNSRGQEVQITDAKVYILADQVDNGTFSPDYNYTDYSQEPSLLFFQPTNNEFKMVSNALPTILDIPSGKSGWYIKRSGLANYCEFAPDTEGLPNLYDRYENLAGIDKAPKMGRSFMEIGRLGEDWVDDVKSYYTYTSYHNNDNIDECDNYDGEDENKICLGHDGTQWEGNDFPGRAYHLGTFTGLAANTFNDGKYSEYSCYKLNSAGTGFAKVKSSSTVQPFRTFFAVAPGVADITGTPSTGAKAYTLGFCGVFEGEEDTPTSVDEVVVDGEPVQGIHLMTTEEAKIYSIDGRYVGQYGQKALAPGMYLMNGKKFVVK